MLSKSEFEASFFSSASDIWWKKKPAIITYLRGQPTKAGALVFALEHSYFAANFPRWLGNLVANCPLLKVRQYFIENMFIEEVKDPTIHEGHYESMVDFAVGCGAKRDAVYDYRPSVSMLTAIHYWDNISRTKAWLPGFAAIGGLEFLNHAKLAQSNGEMPLNSRAMFQGLRLGSEHMHHWEAGEAADQDEEGHGQKTIDILVEYATTAELQQHVLDTFCESISVFSHVYDGIGRRAFEKDGKGLPQERVN